MPRQLVTLERMPVTDSQGMPGDWPRVEVENTITLALFTG